MEEEVQKTPEPEANAAKAAATQRSIRHTKIALSIIIPLCLVLGIYDYVQTMPPPNGKYDAFARCIADTSTTFYGAWWCPHCAAQKPNSAMRQNTCRMSNARIPTHPKNKVASQWE